ncbi:MAG: malonyl-ACP O-methyltransferase BioC [Bacillota bacterium]
MMINKKILQMHFSRNAANYDAYAKVQKKMADELLKMISLDFNNKSGYLDILDIGCGTGYLTKQLVSYCPNARITAVDIAPGMIEYAKEKLKECNIEFQCVDIEEVKLNKKFDMIISNATFQWFNNLKGTIQMLGQMLEDNGWLAFSTFGHMTFNELNCSHEIAREKLKMDGEFPPSQKFFRPEEIFGICKENVGVDFTNTYKIDIKESLEYEYFNSVREFLDSVRKIGANNSNKSHRANTSLTKEMIRTYEEMYKINGLIRATYHCIFITARKIGNTENEGRSVKATG